MKIFYTIFSILLFSVCIINNNFAQCTISTNTNASAINLNGCGGELQINNGAILTVNQNVDLSSAGPLTLIISNNAVIQWSGNYTLKLAEGSAVILQSGGVFSTSNPCNANKVLRLGTIDVADCSGGGALYSFAQLNAAGGTPSVRPTLSQSYGCSSGSVNVTGNPSGILPSTSVTYQWTGSGPGSFTFSAPTSANTAINGITTPGVYQFTLKITAQKGSTSFSYSKSRSYTLYVPPVNQSVQANATTTCKGGTNRIFVANSELGVNYQLIDNSNSTVLQTLSGTGSQLQFNLAYINTARTYIIKAIKTGVPCETVLGAPITISAGETPKNISRNLDSKECFVEGNDWIDFVNSERWIISINPNGQILGNVTATSYVSNSPINIPACGTSQTMYTTTVMGRRWAITPQFQPSSPISLRLFFNESEFELLYDAANINTNLNDDFPGQSHSEILLAKYSNSTNPQVVNGSFSDNCVAGGTTTTHTQTREASALSINNSFQGNGRFVQFSIPSFSEFWLHGGNNVSPLPIVLTDFDAACAGENVAVTWTTATEINNAFFTVSRSADAVTWETVEVVAGAGNSNQERNYSILDTRPLSGTAYYRLHQVDLDGTTEYFDPISVSCNDALIPTSVSIFPNPSESHFFNISVIANLQDPKALVEVFDVTGFKTMSTEIVLQAGANTIPTHAESLASGTYIVRVVSNGNMLGVQKVILQ